MTKRYLQYR